MKGSLARGKLRMESSVAAGKEAGTVDITVEVTENTLAESPRVEALADRMEADFGADVTTDAAASLVEPAAGLLSGRCVGLLKECGKVLVKHGIKILPCVSLLRNVKLIVTCAGATAVMPIIGGICLAVSTTMAVRNAQKCVQGVKETYEKWDEKMKETGKACGDLRSCSAGK
jgi:hypothetical protein